MIFQPDIQSFTPQPKKLPSRELLGWFMEKEEECARSLEHFEKCFKAGGKLAGVALGIVRFKGYVVYAKLFHLAADKVRFYCVWRAGLKVYFNHAVYFVFA